MKGRLLNALEVAGCPACNISRRSAARHIRSLLWESVTDVDTRQRLRDAHGFCRTHAIAAISVAGQAGQASGLAILADDFIRHVTGDARAAAGSRRKNRDVRPHAVCPVCDNSMIAVQTALALLAGATVDSELGQAARQTGRFLCLPHLRTGLKQTDTKAQAQRLVELFAPVADELHERLAEYVRKHGYEARDEEIMPEERAALVEATRLLVGEI